MLNPCPLSGKKREKERRDRKEKDPFKLKQKKKKKKKKKSKQYCKSLHFSVVFKGILAFSALSLSKFIVSAKCVAYYAQVKVMFYSTF